MSSVLLKATYDTETEEMVITFKTGKEYSYYSIPKIVWNEFRTSESKGSFFSRQIKGKYGEPKPKITKPNNEIPSKKNIVIKPLDGEVPAPPTMQEFLNNKKREA